MLNDRQPSDQSGLVQQSIAFQIAVHMPPQILAILRQVSKTTPMNMSSIGNSNALAVSAIAQKF